MASRPLQALLSTDGVSKNAKQENKTTCVDIVQAYDHVGHLHLQKCLESIPFHPYLKIV